MDSSTAVVFKCKMLRSVYLGLAVISAIIIYLIGLAIISGSWASDGAALCTITSIFSLTAAVVAISASDVVIDDNGISRCLLGATWKRICWDNIRLITAFPVSDGYGKTMRGFNIFPKEKPWFRLLPSGKMTFTDSVIDATSMVRLLNFHAQKNGIRIEARETMLAALKPVPRL